MNQSYSQVRAQPSLKVCAPWLADVTFGRRPPVPARCWLEACLPSSEPSTGLHLKWQLAPPKASEAQKSKQKVPIPLMTLSQKSHAVTSALPLPASHLFQRHSRGEELDSMSCVRRFNDLWTYFKRSQALQFSKESPDYAIFEGH